MNNKILAGIVALIMIGTPTLASTTIDSTLVAYGDTTYSTHSNVAGFDWTEQSMEMTAFITETITNDGYLVVKESFQNPNPWEMHEYKHIDAIGVSTIDKHVDWWTEDSRTCGGKMLYPTVTNVFIRYHDKDSNRLVDFENVANENIETPAGSGEFSRGWYDFSEQSDVSFEYEQAVGIGMPTDCTFTWPVAPVMPTCC